MPAPRVAAREAASRELAREVLALVAERAQAGRLCVLGLATGATPRALYAELVRAHDAGGPDLAHVVTVNLDEYLGLAEGDERGFRAEMRARLHGPLGIPPERAWFPPSRGEGADLARRCAEFEGRLAALGGVDLQLLGIGRNGHLAFNEPGAPLDGRTREVLLQEVTRADAAARFGELERVPRGAVTLGLATILEARALRVLAFGAAKREVVARALTGPLDTAVPASALRLHTDCRVWLDAEAAGELLSSAPRP
ncbi:MAG TPA: glucosamine-6-phosphate deaminase [Planctomycetota bacterium]|nr:glucosamine-6-phosphate deaminase [Planctomycetota bacterium]